jgi:hypothetical protein
LQEKDSASHVEMTTTPTAKIRSHLGGWQRHRLFESDDLVIAVGVNDIDGTQLYARLLDKDRARARDEMVHILDEDLHHVVLGIVSKAVERCPFDLIAELEAGNFDLGMYAAELARYTVEVLLPLRTQQPMLAYGYPTCLLPRGSPGAAACSGNRVIFNSNTS